MCKSNIEQHQFYCIKCGQAGMPLARQASRRRERFHRKVLYCIHCKEEVNHIECKNEADIIEFKENFANGVYKDECEESLAYLRSKRI